MTNKLILILTILTISFKAFSFGVFMSDSDEPIVRMTVASTYDLTVDVAGDGKTEAAAYKVYVPMKGTSLPELYFTGLKTNLATPTSGTMTFYLNVDVDATEKYLVIAAKDGSETNYEIVEIFNSTTFSSDAEAFGLNVSVTDLCITTGLNCTSAGLTSDNTSGKQTYYIFLADTDITNDDINPEDFSNGMYVEINYSTKVDSSFSINLSAVAPGDESLYLTYSTSNSQISSFKDVVIIDGGTANAPFHGTGGLENPTIIGLLESSSTSGLGQVKNLTNGQDYDVTVAFRNKYLFATPQSNQRTGQPLEIEDFLEKNSCYLISAGFKTDHYVLTFLRHFRDNVLLKNSLGRAFVQLYYSSAPSYARVIYRSEFLSSIFRGLGWITYFVIKYFYYIMVLILALVIILLTRKSEFTLGRSKVN